MAKVSQQPCASPALRSTGWTIRGAGAVNAAHSGETDRRSRMVQGRDKEYIVVRHILAKRLLRSPVALEGLYRSQGPLRRFHTA